MMLVKMTMKVALLPVMLAVGAVSVLSKVMLNLGSYIMGPLMFFVFCCGIYTVVMQQWTQFFILALIELACVTVFFGAGWIVFLLEDLSAALSGLMHA